MDTFDFSNYQKLSFFSGKDLIEKSGIINQLQRLLEIFEVLPSNSVFNFEDFLHILIPEMKKEDYFRMSSTTFIETVQHSINQLMNSKIQ